MVSRGVRILKVSVRASLWILTNQCRQQYAILGGQIIKRIVKKTLLLPGDEGLEIFKFEGVERKELREQIKTTIDSLELSRTTKDAIIAENIHCFRMNIQLVKAINIKWSNYQRLGIVAAAVLIVLVVAFCYWHAVFL